MHSGAHIIQMVRSQRLRRAYDVPPHTLQYLHWSRRRVISFVTIDRCIIRRFTKNMLIRWQLVWHGIRRNRMFWPRADRKSMSKCGISKRSWKWRKGIRTAIRGRVAQIPWRLNHLENLKSLPCLQCFVLSIRRRASPARRRPPTNIFCTCCTLRIPSLVFNGVRDIQNIWRWRRRRVLVVELARFLCGRRSVPFVPCLC